MALLQLNLQPSRKDLRWFAGLWFPAFAGMVGYLVYRKLHSPSLALSVWGVAAVLSLAGLWAPAVIRPVYRGLMRLTFPIGWVMSHVMLFIAYFLVITPVGAIVRLFHDPMKRGLVRSAKSYWVPCEQREKIRYLRQF